MPRHEAGLRPPSDLPFGSHYCMQGRTCAITCILCAFVHVEQPVNLKALHAIKVEKTSLTLPKMCREHPYICRCIGVPLTINGTPQVFAKVLHICQESMQFCAHFQPHWCEPSSTVHCDTLLRVCNRPKIGPVSFPIFWIAVQVHWRLLCLCVGSVIPMYKNALGYHT